MKLKNLQLNETESWNKTKKLVKGSIAAVVVGTSIVASSVPVSAYVDSSSIVFEQDHYANTKNIKKQEAKKIKSKFEEELVTADDVKKAIELSNALNNYYPAFNEYSNTNLQEILNLNIEYMYADEQYALYSGNNEYNRFCQNNLKNMAAIDGYLTLSCYSVCDDIETAIANRVVEAINAKGFTTQGTKVHFTNKGAIVMVSLPDGLIKVNVSGDIIDELKQERSYLSNKYKNAYNNISGKSDYYETTFCTNGFIRDKKAQAYLCVAGDELKGVLSETIDKTQSLNSSECVSLTTGSFKKLTSSDRKLLKQLGYDESDLRDTRSLNVTFSKVNNYTYKLD